MIITYLKAINMDTHAYGITAIIVSGCATLVYAVRLLQLSQEDNLKKGQEIADLKTLSAALELNLKITKELHKDCDLEKINLDLKTLRDNKALLERQIKELEYSYRDIQQDKEIDEKREALLRDVLDRVWDIDWIYRHGQGLNPPLRRLEAFLKDPDYESCELSESSD